MFNFGKKKKIIPICTPVNGKCVPLESVPDPIFSSKMVGDGIAIIPSDGIYCAPADGEITMITEKGHAFSLKLENGLELLIHIGLETYNLNDCIEICKKVGDYVNCGDCIIKVNMKKASEMNVNMISMVIIVDNNEITLNYIGVNKDVKVKDPVLDYAYNN